jgi:hypothetical protein
MVRPVTAEQWPALRTSELAVIGSHAVGFYIYLFWTTGRKV